MGAPVDWDDLAYENNFTNDKLMLTHFHHTLKMSQDKIGLKLNLCGATIGKRMKKLGIKVIYIPSNLPSYSPRLPKKGVD
jgi:hypothetical protein